MRDALGDGAVREDAGERVVFEHGLDLRRAPEPRRATETRSSSRETGLRRKSSASASMLVTLDQPRSSGITCH